MKRKLFFTTFLMLLCTFVFGQSNSPRYEVSYTGNYSNSMTITTVISFDGEIQNKELELGVFCNNEVRASVMTRNHLGDGNYYAYINIFGELGDVLTFKVYDHSTNKEWANGCTFKNGSYIYEELSFVENADYGNYDNPCVINFTTPNYWTPNDNFEAAPTTVIAVVEIDEVEQANPNLELGAFCGDECRGSVKTDYVYTYKGVQRYYAMMEVFGSTGDVITFKLYNHEGNGSEYTNFVDVNTITLNPEEDGYEMIGSYSAPLKVNFLTKPYVAEVNGKKYQNFDIAFNAALENNATITLLENFAIDSETYTVADGKNVTLNMNGKKITVEDNKTSNYELFYIYGGMTVEGEGTIELTSANNRGWNAMSAIFHNRGGVLTIKNGTYKNLGGTDMAYVIDNSGNYYGDATTNITEGVFTSSYIAIRNRMEQNTHGASGKAILNIAGGEINGQRRAIWAQAASTSTTAPATGEINVIGGTIGLIETACNEGAVSMTTVTGGTVAEFIGESGELKVNGGTVTDVTIKTAAGVEVPYAITSVGLYVAAVAVVNGTYYATLQEAVNAANGSEVKVLMNFAFAETYEIASGVTANINLNGFTMTGSILAPNANLTIKNGTIINKDRSVSGIEINAGKLNLDNVNISSARHAVRIDGDVEATINGGEYTLIYTSGTTMTLYAVNVSGAAEVTIKDGKFVGPKGTSIESGSAVNVKTGAKVTIEGGDFSGGKTKTLSVSGTMVVIGGTYDQDVTDYCAPSYICVRENDKYKVIRGLRGSGTETDPYLIHNLTELEYFRNSVNAGETTYNAPGRWVALADNIDMAEANWERGIGDGINATFDGIFDGKNYTIKNLKMNPEADADGYVCGGLFGYTYGAATIQNLTLENVAIATTDAGHNVGALVGFANNNGGQLTVKNVTVKGVVIIDAPNVDGVGAIVGYSYRSMGTISGCTVDAKDGSYIKGHSFVGGITGYSYSNATIANCSVKNINITATSKDAAAIAGLVLGGNKVSGCTVENVTVAAQANYASVVGAIAANGIIVEDCTAAEPMVGGNYSDSKPVQARIGNKYYATIADAKAVVAEGEVIAVANNFAIEETITIAEGETVVLDLNGKTITGTDKATTSFGLITNRGNLTIQGEGAITLTATNNRGWNAYSSVISNTVGGKLTVNGGTIEHLGGTDMAYGIDNLTNGKNTYAETVINGGTVKSTYRAVRQFLNGVEAQNILTVNGGTIEGANKSIWMQDPSANANSGKLTVAKEAVLNGDVYLFVTAGSTVWPVEVAIANAALSEGSELLTGNVPATYSVEQVDGIWGVYAAVASVNGVGYTTVTKAINAAQDGETVQLHALTIDEAIAPWAGDSQHRLEKSITIVGAKDENGNLLTTLTGGLFLGYNDGTVRNNTITVKDINFVGKGVTVANQKNVVIEGNKFTGIDALVSEQHGNSGSAILIIGTENEKSIVATVENNVIENVTGTKQAGIYMSQVANATVKGNTVTGTTHNAITISAATDGAILVENNTLSQWGLSGEGRAMRISGGATVNVNGNVMSNTAAPEDFVKITGAATIDASANYWNGNTPLAEKMFLTDLTSDPVTILDSYYTDAEKTNLVKLAQSVAKIGTKYYQSFAKAIEAVENDEKIELLTNCAENVTIKQLANNKFTINGNGKTYTGTINVNGDNKGGGLVGAGLTITNVNFKNEVDGKASVGTSDYACNITVDNCTFTGKDGISNYGIKIASGMNITVKNTVASNLYELVYSNKQVNGFTAYKVKATEVVYGFFFSYGQNLNFEEVEVAATEAGIGINNYNSSTAIFTNCNLTAKWPVYFQSKSDTKAYNLVFNGTENSFVSNVVGEEWLTVEKTSAVITAIYNDEELVAVSSMPAKIGKVHYNSLQHAINAAQDGDTVAIANDFTLDSKKYEIQDDGYAVLVNVKNKSITIDLNGKTVTVEASAADHTNAKGKMFLAVFHADTRGQLTFVDSSADKGNVNVNINDAKVYSVFASENLDKPNSGKIIVNSGTYRTVGKVANAMVYADANEVITINGGTFIPEGISILSNYPWFVNTLGNNELRVVVNGGTFNADINHQYRPFEIYIKKELALKNNGDGTWTIVPAEAYVTELLGGTVNEVGEYAHNVGYATLEEAVAAVNNLGKTVTLLKNVETEEIIVLDKAVNLNGANFTLTSTADRAINVNFEGDVNISNLIIATTNNTERAINVIQKAANLTLNNVIAEGFKYTINVASSSVGSTINTVGGKFSGYAAVNIAASNTTFNSNGTELIGINNVPSHESNNYAVIAVNTVPTENVNVNINGGKVVAQTNSNRQFIATIKDAKDANITINAELELVNGDVLNATIENGLVVKVKAEYADELLAQGYVSSTADANGLVTVLGVKVAQVEDTYYATLQDAIDAADGKTVVVLANIEQNGTTDVTGTVTIDLNGFTVTGTPAEAAAYAVINNRGDLTIQGEGSIICNHTLAGSTGYAVNAITNCGTLTIEGATIANTSTADYQIGYAIDNNSTTGNAVVVVESGMVIASGSNYYDGIRQFCNSLTNENDVTIEGGEVSTLWMQNPSDGAEKNTKDVKGSFSITGGKVGVVSTEPSANFTASITAGEIGRVEYFQEAEGRNLVNYITGGAFKEDPSAFVAENYSAIYDDNIEYYIVKLTSGTQTREFTEGWNWFSSYINLSTSTGLEQLETALGTSGVQIKGRNNQFATYTCDKEGNNCFWFGAPFTISPTKMYMIKTSEAISAENFEISGDLIDYETTAISLNKGWNWISYPLQETVEINEALKNLDAKHNDKIKGYGQNYVATYYSGIGWIASAGTFNFVPGQGYMYNSLSSTSTSFIYSASSTGNNSRGTTKPEASVENNYWRLNASQYANNMVVFGMLSVDGEIMDSEYEIAAFANGECRGSARPFYIEELDKYMVFMTIYGEEVEELTFKCYDVNYGTEYELSNRVNYSNDAVLGSIDEPYMFNMNFLNIEESTLDMINIYPNPTTRDRAINLQATCDNVEVFNALGVKIAEYQNVDTIDALETAGVYVIRVTINGETRNCRLVVE